MTSLLAPPPPQKKKRLVFFVLKVICRRYTFSLPALGNCYFLGLSKCLPESDFYLPGQLGKCLCSTSLLFASCLPVSDTASPCPTRCGVRAWWPDWRAYGPGPPGWMRGSTGGSPSSARPPLRARWRCCWPRPLHPHRGCLSSPDPCFPLFNVRSRYLW